MEVTMSRKNNTNKRSTNNTGKRISEHNSYRRPQNQQEKCIYQKIMVIHQIKNKEVMNFE